MDSCAKTYEDLHWKQNVKHRVELGLRCGKAKTIPNCLVILEHCVVDAVPLLPHLFGDILKFRRVGTQGNGR